MRIRPDKPGPGQESVWDYPRPPRVEPVSGRVTIELNGQRIVDTTRALRVLETSHPPTVYVPRADIVDGALRDADGTSFCEFKGRAGYLDVVAGDRVAAKAAWYYPNPSRGYEELVDHVAIYPGRMDECTLDGELVTAQEGDFYGGWITSRVVGPFKGAPGTWGW
ncbi:MAG TPA: DUF427 domain-containing protein [Microcella sp.]|nr:DUF427 domain-containing protein [Microcella sp.]